MLEGLLSAQRALRSRFDDFRRALERRDEEAYRMALADFHRCLVRWTQAEEQALLPAILRASIPGRDPQRELRLEWVQVRELTRYLLSQVTERASISDILGLSENLERRLAAHESEMEKVYYPAAAPILTARERASLAEASPSP
jgi:hemerythrin HHE cation binding domain-containing protein